MRETRRKRDCVNGFLGFKKGGNKLKALDTNVNLYKLNTMVPKKELIVLVNR